VAGDKRSGPREGRLSPPGFPRGREPPQLGSPDGDRPVSDMHYGFPIGVIESFTDAGRSGDALHGSEAIEKGVVCRKPTLPGPASLVPGHAEPRALKE
jgi:hypothetical protein